MRLHDTVWAAALGNTDLSALVSIKPGEVNVMRQVTEQSRTRALEQYGIGIGSDAVNCQVVEAAFAQTIAAESVDSLLTTGKIAVQNVTLLRAREMLDAYASGVFISPARPDCVGANEETTQRRITKDPLIR